jgi:hypothetical protein
MKNEKNGLVIFAAVLPLFAGGQDFREIFFMAGCAAILFWGTAVFFRAASPLFPERLRDPAWVLWTAAWTQAGVYAAGLSPFCALAAFLLRGSPLVKPSEGDTFWRGLAFWMLAAFLGLGREILGRGLGLRFFLHPAGLLFLFLPALFAFSAPAERKAWP